MKRWILIGFLILGGACSKKKSESTAPAKPEDTVNNPVTRYVDNLHSDVDRARHAAEIANQKNAELEAESKLLKDQQ